MRRTSLQVIATGILVSLVYAGAAHACIDITLEGGSNYACYMGTAHYSLAQLVAPNMDDSIASATWTGTNCTPTSSTGEEFTATFDKDGGGAGVSAAITVLTCRGYTYTYGLSSKSTTVLKISQVNGLSTSVPVGSSWTVSVSLDKVATLPTTHTVTWTGNATFSNKHGTSATATVPSIGTNKTISAQLSCGGPTVTSTPFNVVEVQKLQYWKDGAWQNVPDPLVVLMGTNVHFRAVTNPEGTYWPGNKPVWSGTSGVDDRGGETFITFGAHSETMTDYKTVIAECGNTKTARVCVIEVVGLKFKRGGAWRSVDPYYNGWRFMGAFVGDAATFGVDTIPADAELWDGCIQWGGAASGNEPEAVVTFEDEGFTGVTASVLGHIFGLTADIIFAPTPPREEEWAATHPEETAIALWLDLDGQAITWANTAYPGQQTDSIADAARHAYWCLLMARYCGATYAMGVGRSHEYSNLGSRPSTIMDLHNNAVGISLREHSHGSDNSCCQQEVMYAVDIGSLWYLDAGSSSSDETALLQPTGNEP